MAAIPFFALTTRGLEFVAAQEIAAVRGANVEETAYRRVSGSIEGSPARLLNLRSADDVYLQVGTWLNVGSQRSTLAVFTEQTRHLELNAAVEAIRGFRHVSDPPTFSVTTSFVGKRNYSAEEIKGAVAAGIESAYGWTYSLDDREADLNLRLFIEHEAAFIGLRLALRALHERPYKTAQIAGSLKPSVAAALIMLAEQERGARLLDPFCGAGTILAEAAALGYKALGGDLSPEAVAAAQHNALQIPCICWDARRLPLRAQLFDAVVSNPPWDRQVVVDQALAELYSQSLAELRRVLKPGGVAVLLTSAPHLLMQDGLTTTQQLEISLFGQRPTVTVMRAEG